MSKVKTVICPHCNTKVKFKKNSTGQIVGTVAGGAGGYVLASTLGIAGTVIGAPIAIPAAIVGGIVAAVIGNRAGDSIDRALVKCPKCHKNFSI